MKRFLLMSAMCAVSVVLLAVDYCAPGSWGCAGTSVTGGGNATPTLVSSFNELKNAIGGKNPKDKVVIITKDITFTSMLTLQDAQNITIMALPDVKLTSNEQTSSTSGILFVKRSSNIIIRNIMFVGPGAYDCDGNDNLCFEKVTNSWVDHCDFQDGCDGNFDNKSTTDNITVTWCRFRYLKEPKAGGSGGSADHRFTNLLGSSSSDAPTDGTYNMTWAYCWWDDGCKERMVRCRNAELHFLNCYWNSSVANYYVGPENASCYFEGCTFEGKANTKNLIFKSYGGTNACKFVNCSGNLPKNSGSVSAPTYAYDKLSPSESKSMVTNSSCGAGATLVVNMKGEVGSSCDGGTTPDPDPEDPDPEDPTPSGDLTWNFSSNEFTALTGDIVSTTTVKGLKITATSEKKVTEAVNSAEVKIGDLSFSHVLKTGGTGNQDYRTLSFAVTGSCTIDVYLISAKNTEERTLNIYSGSYGGSLLGTLPAGKTASKQTYNYTGGAATLYLGSAINGINFYAINLVYSGEEPPAEKPVYTLSYDENGGSGEMEEQEAEEGAKLTVKSNGFSAPTGYVFSEWNDNYKGAGTKYTAGQEVTMNADLTLYAVWVAKTYTVTLEANGGSGGTTSVKVTFDEAMPNISIPSREGYIFLGYFDESGKQYYDANGSSTNSWTTASNATLSAQWEEKSSETPTVTGDLHFWFFNAEDAETNGVSNDEAVFTEMVAAGSQMAGSITIDGTSYAITRRTGDPSDGKFGKFTIPSGKKGVFYALAVSSGGGDRQINLVCGSNKYEFIVPGGSSSYQRLESDELPAGTYSIEREGSSNVRLGIVVLRFIDGEGGGGEGGDDPGDPPIDELTWNFSTNDFNSLGTFTETQKVKDLTMVATPDQPMEVATSSKTIEGITFTHALKTRGTGSPEYRILSFIVTGQCDIEVYLISSKSAVERTLNICSGSYDKDHPIGTLTAGKEPSKQVFKYTGGPATLYLGSASDGITFYAINVKYPSTSPTEIVKTSNNVAAHKILREGQVFILREGQLYTLMGARVQ